MKKQDTTTKVIRTSLSRLAHIARLLFFALGNFCRYIVRFIFALIMLMFQPSLHSKYEDPDDESRREKDPFFPDQGNKSGPLDNANWHLPPSEYLGPE